MHWNFNFSAIQILWILTFAGHLVLLVVLMGREHTRRFPFFTASITLAALMLLTNKLLSGRLPQITMGEVYLTLADVASVIGLLVILELARQSFRSASRLAWTIGTLAMAAIGGAVLFFWGHWPQWKAISTNSLMAHLGLMQLVAQKSMLLADVLAICLGLLVIFCGRRFGAGWHSHVQRIVIGLMTAAISQITLEATRQSIASHAIPKSREEYDRLVGLLEKLLNANSAVYIAVLVWWIVCLWKQEPGAAEPAAALPVIEAPAAAQIPNSTAAPEA